MKNGHLSHEAVAFLPGDAALVDLGLGGLAPADEGVGGQADPMARNRLNRNFLRPIEVEAVDGLLFGLGERAEEGGAGAGLLEGEIAGNDPL